MKKRSKIQLLPIWAYVVSNLVFLALLVVVYYATQYYAAENKFINVALFPILLVAFLSVLIASGYDAFYDRLMYRRYQRERENNQEIEIVKGTRDGIRKSE